MNVMMLAKIVLHILQQGCNEGTMSFETLNRSIRYISNDINAATKKSQTQKQKESEAKPWKTKAIAKVARKEVVEKRTPIIESSLSFDIEVSLPPSKEELYIVLEVAPINDQRLIHFAKAKLQSLNSTKSFSIFIFFLFEYIS